MAVASVDFIRMAANTGPQHRTGAYLTMARAQLLVRLAWFRDTWLRHTVSICCPICVTVCLAPELSAQGSVASRRGLHKKRLESVSSVSALGKKSAFFLPERHL